MHSVTYRYFCLDAGGQLNDVEWFSAESDIDAAAEIGATHPAAKCAIWRGTRLVARLDRGRLLLNLGQSEVVNPARQESVEVS